ncbi:MAG: hypothetical protein ABI593_04415 [Betaproteobacteria bacterium]
MKSAVAAIVVLQMLLFGVTVTSSANAQTTPAKETRIQKADILKHPVGQLALKYTDALHGGDMDDAMKLASSKAQARWKSYPASERKESAAFRKKMIPNRAELTTAIEAGGILIIEEGSSATLNVVKSDSSASKAGVVHSSSATIAIPFVLEGGQWKVAQ